MSSSVSETNLEKRFQGATNTQDSIQTLSLWLVHHKAHYQKIVSSWMKVLQRAKISHRLTLFYLANDVIQNSKRKGFIPYLNAFAEVLREATLLVRDENIRATVLRVFNIWEERGVYSAEFVTELRAILSNSKVPASAPTKLLSTFKPEVVVQKLRTMQKIEMATTKKMSSINLTKLNATNAEIIQQLKDRIHGQQFKRDFDESLQSLEELIEKLTEELNERNEIILLLEQSEIYYDTQKGEAKVVANAYKNFGTRVKNLQKKLEELSSTLPSPLPSPILDAPSPSSDQELELELPQEDSKELENIANAPSPEGSPEGLDLPSDTKPQSMSSNLGNPIPTLSNFFSHDHSGMPSWLDTFRGKSEKNISEKSKTQPSIPSSSLDSRLSNLLQNIPNLPSGLQSSLFSSSSSSNVTLSGDAIDSSSVRRKDKHLDASLRLTPNKDECSGQNTPLQDEDNNLTQSFLNKVSNTKQDTKDILKGLANLIHPPSMEKEDNQRNFFSPSDIFNPQDNMSSFIKSSVPPSTQISSSFFNNTSSSLPPPVRTLSTTIPTTMNSYQAPQFDNVPTYSTIPVQENNTSFIPSIVPSMLHDTYVYSTQSPFSSEEYNPELELYNTDMDIDNDVQTPEVEALSPTEDDPTPIKPSRPIGGRRLSTLITVVTKDSPEQTVQSDLSRIIIEHDHINKNMQKLPHTNVKDLETSFNAHVEKTTNEEFKVDKMDSAVPFFSIPPPNIINTQNGQIQKDIDSINGSDNSLLRIETVQSHREHLNGRWFNESRTDNGQRGGYDEPPFRGPGPNNFSDANRSASRPNFQNRPPWSPRFRHDMPFRPHRNHPFPPRPYGPPHHYQHRFPFRGRGWNRPPPQY